MRGAFTMLLPLLVAILGMAGLCATAPTVPAHLVLEPSYAELAKSLVPAQFDLALSLLSGSVTPSMQPDGVKTLRINILRARDLLDMFSYAYNNATGSDDISLSDLEGGQMKGAGFEKKHHHGSTDMYLRIRDDLDRGYEVLGAFQDLAHSLVKYNESDVENYRAQCLQWQDSFLSHLFLRSYTTLLASPDPEHLYDRPSSKLSKLFWGYKGAHPSLQLSGTANMAVLAASLMAEAADELPHVLAMKRIYDEPLHSRFHLYRKLIRSLISVLESCPGMMPDVESPSAQQPWSERLKALVSQAVFRRGEGPRPLGGWRSKPLLMAQAQREDGAAACPDSEGFLHTLQKIFHDLGQVNNWIVSYDFYEERGMAAEAEDSKQRVVDMWADVADWMAGQDLPEQLSCIGRALLAKWVRLA